MIKMIQLLILLNKEIILYSLTNKITLLKYIPKE